jgi:hypothetical protein
LTEPTAPFSTAGSPAPPGLVLLLARLCSAMEEAAVPAAMEALALTFPGQGGGLGSDQPPAFVAGEVARW